MGPDTCIQTSQARRYIEEHLWYVMFIEDFLHVVNFLLVTNYLL